MKDWVKLRFARPSLDLDALAVFYGPGGLGLCELGGFCGHGYDGLIFGTPDGRCELEFTRCAQVTAVRAPSEEHLLVLYFPDRAAIAPIAERLRGQGRAQVAPLNPYWGDKALCFEDPDGWQVVLCDVEALERCRAAREAAERAARQRGA